MVSWVGLSWLGHEVESGWGWLSGRPQRVVVLRVGGQRRRKGGRRSGQGQPGGQGWGGYLRQWRVPLVRSLVLLGLWWGSGRSGPGWLVGLPWLGWGWQLSGWLWPELRGQPEWRLVNWLLWQGQRLVLGSYLGLGLSPGWREGELGLRISLGCLVCGRNEPWVEVERQGDGSYQAEVCDHFRLRVAGDEPFRARLLLLFLRLLEVDGPERRIGRTRDDRAPFVRQMQVAACDYSPPSSPNSRRKWLEPVTSGTPATLSP